MLDPESNLHIVEIKVRLRPDDAALLNALAVKRDVPRAVLARTLLRRAMGLVEEYGAKRDDYRSPA